MGTGSSLAVEVVVRFILRFSDFFSEELLATLKLGTPKVTPIPVLTLFFFFFWKDLQRLQRWEPCRSLAATVFLSSSVCQVPALLEAGGEVKEQAISTVLGKDAGSAGFQNRQREKHCAPPCSPWRISFSRWMASRTRRSPCRGLRVGLAQNCISTSPRCCPAPK